MPVPECQWCGAHWEASFETYALLCRLGIRACDACVRRRRCPECLLLRSDGTCPCCTPPDSPHACGGAACCPTLPWLDLAPCDEELDEAQASAVDELSSTSGCDECDTLEFQLSSESFSFPTDPGMVLGVGVPDAQQQQQVLVGMDIANFIGGATRTKCAMPFPDRVLETVLRGRPLYKAFAFGTRKENPVVQGVIEKAWDGGGFTTHFSVRGQDGHEVNVDDKLCCNMLLEMRRRPETLKTVVFCTGDGNDNGGFASLRESIEITVRDGFSVEVYAWRCNCSGHYEQMAAGGLINLHFWDDYLSAITPTGSEGESKSKGKGKGCAAKESPRPSPSQRLKKRSTTSPRRR